MLKIIGPKVYCFDPRKRRLMFMGTKAGNIFLKTVDKKYFMRIVNGYGLQYDAFTEFEENGINKIRIHEWRIGNTWISTVKDWVTHGRVADYGNGKQMFLSLRFMRLENAKKQVVKQLKKIIPPEIGPIQSSIFDNGNSATIKL